MQAIPWWWRWFYYINPMSYAIYGLIASQLGNDTTVIEVSPGVYATVQQFLEEMLGYKESFVGWCVLILCGFILTFWLTIAYAYHRFNFNKR